MASSFCSIIIEMFFHPNPPEIYGRMEIRQKLVMVSRVEQN